MENTEYTVDGRVNVFYNTAQMSPGPSVSRLFKLLRFPSHTVPESASSGVRDLVAALKQS